MTMDMARIRAETPATESLVHFNNAGASLMAAPAFDSMLDYLRREQAIGGYETAVERLSDTRRFYEEAARLYNCHADEIAFCESDTRAWQNIFYALDLSPGRRIITTQIDYGSHFVSFIQKAAMGVETVVIPCDGNGDVDLDAMRAALDDRAAVITLSHIPTGGGTIAAAAEVGRIARDAGIPFILDACQSSGQISVDVRKIGCTALTATGRKYLRGPRGTGLLYVARDYLNTLEPAMLDQHGVELLDATHYRLRGGATRFENFEVGYAARVGLGAAIAYANDLGLADIEQRILSLGAYCRERLAAIRGISVHDRGSFLGGIVTFSHADHAPAQIGRFLRDHGVNISVSASAGSLVDFQARGLDSLARASLHYYNTTEEVDRMVALLDSLN